jgi:hypothetical protein
MSPCVLDFDDLIGNFPTSRDCFYFFTAILIPAYCGGNTRS